MQRNRFHSVICVWVAATVAAGGCRTAVPVARPQLAPTNPNTPAALAAATTSTGRPQIPIAIDAGGALTVRFPVATVASGGAVVTQLSASETKALIKRLEPLPDLSGHNAAAPTMRAPSAAPPRPGFVQPIAFAVPTGKAVSDAPIAPTKVTAPLVPPQITPQGEVRSESEVRIRFDEPMVPVASVGEVSKPPAAIVPAVAGTWRWIDTRVLTFTAKDPRLPQATELTVTVPAGIKALSGATLAADAKATFSTRPVEIAGGFPTTAILPGSPIVVQLDQDIDAARIVSLLRVDNAKGKPLAFKATTLETARNVWRKNPSIEFTDKLQASRYVVLAPVTEWPAGSEIQVALKVGAPSKEGPRVTARESFTTFQVAAPFTVMGLTCADVETPRLAATCPARGYIEVQLANPIAPASFRSRKVQIEGEPLQDHEPGGSTVLLIAPKPVGRTYAISIGDGLVDVYGQQLTGTKRLSFTTSPERFGPVLNAPGGLHVLDPRFQVPQWVVRAEAVKSLRVQLFQVQPTDFFAFQDYEAGKRGTPPGKQIVDESHVIGPRDGADLRVDLRPALDKTGTGHVIAVATVIGIPYRKSDQSSRKVSAWIQVTKLGVTARTDGDKLNAWVQDITPTKFLTPTEGVTTTFLIEGRGETASAVSDKTGHVAFELLPPAKRPSRTQEPTALLLARSGTDSTFTAIGSYEKAIREHNALWYVTDDRFMYKPNEKVYVKGWVRWTHTGVNPDLALPAAGDAVTYSLTDSRGIKVGGGTAPLSDQGGFDLEVALPPNVNLGTASFHFSTKTASHSHPIAIEEFRTPAFAVNLNDDVSHAGATPVILGESIEMTTTAKYYAGGGLGGAPIQWDATLAPATYQPPGWNEYTFTPPRTRAERRYYGSRDIASVTAHETSNLSGGSSSSVVFGLAALPANHPSVLDVDATVTDLDRMSIRASSRTILVHPSAYYVGLRGKPGTINMLEAVVTDIDGNVVPGVPIKIDIEGVLGSERYRDDAEVIDTQDCKLTSGAEPVTCGFTRRDLKTAYSATATIADRRSRTNVAAYDIPWYSWEEAKQDFAIVPDKAEYRPGDIAKLDIRSTVLPATAVVTFARQGVIAQQRLELTKASTIVELPIEPAFIQNVHVVVDRVGKRRRMQSGSTLPLPEHTAIELSIPVDVESARLVMKTRSTQPLIEPGENATFEVEVRHGGKPTANAEVALMVVDEAVLALSARSHADPLAPFYRKVGAGTSEVSTIDLVSDSGDVLAGAPGFAKYKLDEMGGRGYGSGAGSIGAGHYGTIGHGSGTGSGVVTARKDFRANAVFSPLLKTDANGKVSLTVKMPDSLTRFRVIALATAGTLYFGKAESAIVTQLKLNARTVAPRFLTQGDAFSLPVLVQNLDRKPRTIDVAVRAANLIATGPTGKRVTIQGGQRAEVRFDFTTKARGKAVVQTIAVSGAFADASNVELPIYEPATTESFATYGTVDDATQFEQLAVPKSIFPDVGGVEVQLASTQLQSLTDAYWYLYAYPYECAEQRSSRMLATAAMYDILDAFETPGRPTHKEIATLRTMDIRMLEKTQNGDGGWGYFEYMKSDPFVTMQVLSALAAEHVAGKMTTRAQAFVGKQATTLFARLEKSVATPPAQQKDRAELPYVVGLAATALTTLAATGADVRPRAARLHAMATALAAYPIDAKARLLALVARQDGYKPMRAKLLTELLSATHETASSATVTARYEEAERLLLVSNTKTSALALDAIIREQPDHALITKLARGVLDGRRYGRWSSTQANLVALQAIRRYFDTYEKATPNYTGKLWFGASAYAEQAFVGRSNARGTASLDWTTLVPGSTHDLALAKTGPGRMYYRIGITYAPTQTNLPALDAGFIVRRSYRGVDDPGDVVKLPDGRWKIRLGAKVVVRLEAVTTTKRYSVALVDPLPAGFEPINTNLATAERAASTAGNDRWDYTNMRDNRSEVFEMAMDEGHHQFTYTVRATTPGTFIAAPAKAEEMYSPETFGRSAGQTVVIE